MGDIGQRVVGGIAAIVSLAVVAIVISQKANTPNVLTAFFGGLSNLIGVAISPVTGQTVSGLGAGPLVGDTGTWNVPVTNLVGTTSTIGGVGGLLTQTGNLVTGANNLVNSIGKISGGGGTTGGGFVDSGSFDTGSFGGGGGFEDVGAFA